ncbi:TlpA disulfide reductase family protein [Psychroflexus aestuariivivens]|uniref:TlpA disulfide reductase family protein n=1 Tax=Psychroflexus aestuariivivens TaxID=1795040 RepID=UPI0018647D35|nr:TlpA disulfide reductase family protein [Psychroflexus aestuariivivens]
MKQLFLFSIILIVFMGCETTKKETKTDQFYLKGIISGDFGEQIILKYNQTSDTAKVENNTFEFRGEIESPSVSKLIFNDENTSERIYISPNDTIFVEVLIENDTIAGQPIENFFINRISENSTTELKTKFESFYNDFEISKSNRNQLFRLMDSLIDAHPNHDYLGERLSQIATDQTLLYDDLQKLYVKFDKNQLYDEDVMLFKKYLERRKEFQIGNKFPNPELTNIQNEKEKIIDGEAELTLVQFWTTWCNNCKMNHEQLEKIYRVYNYKGFEIVDISLNTNKEVWIEKLMENVVPWKNLIDTKGFTGDLANDLGIVNLPQNYLLNKQGHILDININLKELIIILNSNLK